MHAAAVPIAQPLEHHPAVEATADLLMTLETLSISHLEHHQLAVATFDKLGPRVVVCCGPDDYRSYHPTIMEAAIAALRADPPFPVSVTEVVCRTLDTATQAAKRLGGLV